MSIEFFDYPQLTTGSLIAHSENSISVNLGKRNLQLRGQGNINSAYRDILESLRVGDVARKTYFEKYPQINIEDLLINLNKYGLLVEAGAPNSHRRNGKCVITRLEQESLRYIEENPFSSLSKILESGQASQELLLGLAFEYYYLTTAAYDAISPSIGRLHGQQRQIMLEFLLGEYRHDKFMIKSLLAYNVSNETILAATPHPYTRAITDMLTYWASTDPLAFMASLYVLEGRDDGAKLFIELLKKNKLPDGYLDGINEHEYANSDEEHGDISRELFSVIEYISEEEEARIAAKVGQMQTLIARRDDELCRYYVDAKGVCPRIFPQVQ